MWCANPGLRCARLWAIFLRSLRELRACFGRGAIFRADPSILAAVAAFAQNDSAIRRRIYRIWNDLIAIAFGPRPAGSMVNSACSPAVPNEAVRTTATSDERASTTNSRWPADENAMVEGPSPT